MELQCGQDGSRASGTGTILRVVSCWGKQEAGLYTPTSTTHWMQAPLSTQHPDGLSPWVGSPFDQGQFGGVSQTVAIIWQRGKISSMWGGLDAIPQ